MALGVDINALEAVSLAAQGFSPAPGSPEGLRYRLCAAGSITFAAWILVAGDAGFAIERVKPAGAKKTLKMLREL